MFSLLFNWILFSEMMKKAPISKNKMMKDRVFILLFDS